jgi:hypothetical protein
MTEWQERVQELIIQWRAISREEDEVLRESKRETILMELAEGDLAMIAELLEGYHR